MDEYGRLPNEVLKYISMLGAQPTFRLKNVDKYTHTLIVKSPYIKNKYTLVVNQRDLYDEAIKTQKIIKNIENFISDKTINVKIYNYIGLDGYNDWLRIIMTVNKIYLISTNGKEKITQTILPILCLPSLKMALATYHDILNQLYLEFLGL